MPNRQTLLLIAVVALVGWMVVSWFLGDGRVTLNYEDAPVGKVVQSIERQAGVKIVSNVDPTRRVTIRLKRAPFMEAIDTLATRVDADTRLAYIGAPDRSQIKEALAAFAAGTNPGTWQAFAAGWGGGGGGGGGMGVVDGDSIDPRKLQWQLSEATDRNLQAFLNQGAQKTGALFAVPKDWNPVLGGLPSGGEARKMAKAVFSAAKGQMEEVFLMTVRPERPERVAGGEEGDGRPRFNFQQAQTIFSPDRRQRGAEGSMNPQWAAERTQAQIALLPPDQRAQAQTDYEQMRAFWESLRNLTPEERRAKMEQAMNDPAVQDRMEERGAQRDARTSPERREQRYRQYIQRKLEQQGGPKT